MEEVGRLEKAGEELGGVEEAVEGIGVGGQLPQRGPGVGIFREGLDQEFEVPGAEPGAAVREDQGGSPPYSFSRHTSPSAKTSFFQTGRTFFSRSIPYAHAAMASRR